MTSINRGCRLGQFHESEFTNVLVVVENKTPYRGIRPWLGPHSVMMNSQITVCTQSCQ